MQVSGAPDAAAEPLAGATTPRHGAGATADASGFGALLLLLLQSAPAVATPVGDAPLAPGERGAGEAMLPVPPPGAMPAATIETVAGAGSDVATPGAIASTMPGPIAAGSTSALASPLPPAPGATETVDAFDAQATIATSPRADATAARTSAAPLAAGPDTAGRQQAANVAPPPGTAIAAGPDSARPTGPASSATALRATSPGDATHAVEERGDTVAAATETLAPDGAHAMPRPAPRAPVARSVDRQDVDGDVLDQAVLDRAVGAAAPRASATAAREARALVELAPAKPRAHDVDAEPDAATIARVGGSDVRADRPHGAAAPTPPAPADAPRPPAALPVVEQVVHVARVALRDGITEMDVQLTPPSLGVVRVTASAAHDGLGLVISAERPETRALLAHAIPEMQAALASQGISTTTIAVASAFDPPGERRAPARRDPERSSRPARDVVPERARPSRTVAVGAVDLTV